MARFILDVENLSYGYEVLVVIDSMQNELGGQTQGLIKERVYLFPPINQEIDDLRNPVYQNGSHCLDTLLMDDGYVVLQEVLYV